MKRRSFIRTIAICISVILVQVLAFPMVLGVIGWALALVLLGIFLTFLLISTSWRLTLPVLAVHLLLRILVLYPWILTAILWVFAGIFILFLLLLPLRASVMAQYGHTGFLLRAGLGPMKVTLFPGAEKGSKKEKKPKKKKEPEDTSAEQGGPAERLKAAFSSIEAKSVFSIIGPILRQVKRRLVIRELTLHYTVALEDAAMTAYVYGAAHAALHNILPRLRYHFRVKQEDIQVHASFQETADLVFVRAQLDITVWSALCLGIFSLVKVLQSGLLKGLFKKTSPASESSKT